MVVDLIPHPINNNWKEICREILLKLNQWTRRFYSATELQRRMSAMLSAPLRCSGKWAKRFHSVSLLQRPISVTLSQRHCTAAAKKRNALEASLLALLRQPLQLAFIIQCARSCIYLSICFHLSYITHSRNFEKKQTGPMATWYIYEKCTISRKKKGKGNNCKIATKKKWKAK